MACSVTSNMLGNYPNYGPATNTNIPQSMSYEEHLRRANIAAAEDDVIRIKKREAERKNQSLLLLGD